MDKISLYPPEMFKYLKYANYQSDDVIHYTKFWSSMMEKDVLANLYQKCLILCSKILLTVLHDMGTNIWLPLQHAGFWTSPILKAFLASFVVPFWYLQSCLICLIQQAYKDVSSSLWPCLMFWDLKITQRCGNWKRIAVGVFPVELLAY